MAEAGLFENWEELLRPYKELGTNTTEKVPLFIAVDTGATNTRVALGDCSSFVVFAKFKCKSTKTLVAALSSIDDALQAFFAGSQCHAAAGGTIGAAGRVQDNGCRVEITNYDEGVQNLALDDLPARLFPKGRSRILNDLEAACYGISGLSELKKVPEYFKAFKSSSGNAPPAHPPPSKLHFQHYLICAVGTGLGVGLLMALPGMLSGFIVLPLESGHSQFHPLGEAHPRSAEEKDMMSFLSQDIYGGKHSLEYEDIVSGRGLERLYRWAAKYHEVENPPALTPLEISEAALKGECKHCEKALRYHYLYLARASVTLSVILQARGVFWAGDNQVANEKFVDAVREELVEEFLNHTKQEWIADVPIYTQTRSFNINLEGAIFIARKISNQ